MPENSEKKPSPTTLAAILGTVILGLVATRGGGKIDGMVPPKSSPPAASDDGAASGGGSTLAPLEIVMLGEAHPDPVGNTGDLTRFVGTRLVEPWKKKFGDARPLPRVRCLVATVPDPVQASISYQFDEALDSIERAAVVQHFVLERWRFPWAEKPDEAGASTEIDLRWNRLRLTNLRKPRSRAVPHPAEGEPGLLVFRRIGPVGRNGDGAKAEDLLAVFLVTETPTNGMDRPALVRSLKSIKAIEDGIGADRDDKCFRILGPSYSGSMPSLRDGLIEWKSVNQDDPRYALEVISGNASAFDQAGFVGALKPVFGKGMKFSATVHRSLTIQEAVLRYLGRKIDDPDVAILTELNTGFGQAFSEETSKEGGEGQHKGKAKPGSNRGHSSLRFPPHSSLRYPLHIGEVRRVYESQGIFRDNAAEAFRSQMEVRNQAEQAEKPRDILPDQTPGEAAMAENRVLVQSLKYLEDAGFRTIGIVATDTRDAIFLARLVNRYCPDAIVFIVGADLMLLDPEAITDMRGVLVGTTYPLFALNHEWTNSNRSSRGEVFPSSEAQGVYNAAAVLLYHAMNPGVAGDGSGLRDALLEYSAPRAFRPASQKFEMMPPVWISMVGERALFPVDCVMDDHVFSEGSTYLFQNTAPAPPRTAQGRLAIDRDVGWLVALGLVLLGIAIYQVRRPHPVPKEPGDARRHRLDLGENGRFAAVNVALMVLLAFTARPLSVATLIRHPWIQWLAFGAVSAAFILTAARTLLRAPSRRPGPVRDGPARTQPDRDHRRWLVYSRWLETASIVAAALLFWVPVVRSDPRWQLQAVRATALTSGLSMLIPLGFLVAAVGAWCWGSNRLAKVSRVLAQPAPEPAPNHRPPDEAVTTLAATIERHRERFDRLFFPPDESKRPGAWWRNRRGSELVVVVLWGGIVFDLLVLRPVSSSDEGPFFDLVVLATMAGMLLWIGLETARVAAAWKELRKVLGGLEKTLGAALARVPNRTSSWYLDPIEMRSDSRELIVRQIGYAEAVIEECNPVETGPEQPSATPRPWEDVMETFSQLKTSLTAAEPTPETAREERDAVRKIVDHLEPHWQSQSVSGRPREDDEETPTRPSTKLAWALEDLLALEAANWVGGALARVWTLIGSLVVAALAMLLAMSSYPFPEQPRAMTMMCLVIFALAVLVLRVAVGVGRDGALSLLAGNDPGRITWNATFVGNIATYLVPLVGVLAAVSFSVTDLFRSVLGPILRLFP